MHCTSSKQRYQYIQKRHYSSQNNCQQKVEYSFAIGFPEKPIEPENAQEWVQSEYNKQRYIFISGTVIHITNYRQHDCNRRQS